MQKGTLLHLPDSIPSNNPIAFGVAQQAWKHPRTAAPIDHEQAGSGSGNTTNAASRAAQGSQSRPIPKRQSESVAEGCDGETLDHEWRVEVETSRIQTLRRLATVRIQTKS